MCVAAAPEIQADCLSLLALLHHGVCDAWRVCVFSKTLQSPDEVVRAAAVRAFPLLLHHLGSTHHNLISTALLYVLVCSILIVLKSFGIMLMVYVQHIF